MTGITLDDNVAGIQKALLYVLDFTLVSVEIRK